VKFVLEGALGLYSIFGGEVLLGISPDLSIRFGARNALSMHTCRQIGPEIRYEIPSLAVVVLIFVEPDLVYLCFRFVSTNGK